MTKKELEIELEKTLKKNKRLKEQNKKLKVRVNNLKVLLEASQEDLYTHSYYAV